MRKLYIVLSICLSIIVIVGCKTHYPLAGKAFTVIETPTSIERGKNLAFNICADCHYNPAADKFIGMRFMGFPSIGGKVYSANLTNSKVYGVMSKYSNAEFAYLLKTGITRDGRFVPFMLRPKMAEDDINDLIVYFRSKDAAVAGGDTSVGHTHINFIGKMAEHALGKPQPYVESIKRPEKNDAVANGRYLVDQVGCYHCHSKSILKVNYMNAEDTKGYLQGGMKLKDQNKHTVRPCNLTPDKETGTGNYTFNDFKEAIVKGKGHDGRTLHEPMPKFVHLTDKQINDIYAYLQSIPPVQHKVKH